MAGPVAHRPTNGSVEGPPPARTGRTSRPPSSPARLLRSVSPSDVLRRRLTVKKAPTESARATAPPPTLAAEPRIHVPPTPVRALPSDARSATCGPETPDASNALGCGKGRAPPDGQAGGRSEWKGGARRAAHARRPPPPLRACRTGPSASRGCGISLAGTRTVRHFLQVGGGIDSTVVPEAEQRLRMDLEVEVGRRREGVSSSGPGTRPPGPARTFGWVRTQRE
jgi:hypothetical protein